MISLITGGVRSGKSRFAVSYAAHLGQSALYVATATIGDEEMRQRIEQHRAERARSAFPWLTVEEPFDLCGLLDKWKGEPPIINRETVILVDCLTLWLSNWLLRYEHERPVENVTRLIGELTDTVKTFPGTVLLVSNEVGYGVVPDHLLGRQFRDLVGILNQQVASISDQVFLVTAGIPIEIKSRAYRFDTGCQ